VPYVIIDRRKNDKNKSATNRARYVRRVREQVKEAVKEIIRDGNINDSLNGGAKKIRVNKKDLTQPNFQHDAQGGVRDRVLPGNKRYDAGDRLPKPHEDEENGRGKRGSADGEGDDEFEFTLSKEEFLDIFFEDLELPDLVKKDMVTVDSYVMRRAGFSTDGNPSRLNILRSMKQSKNRRVALHSPKRKDIKELEERISTLTAQYESAKNIETTTGSWPADEISEAELEKTIEELKDKLTVLKRKRKAVPFIDDVDLRYNRWERQPVPTTQAVMFGIMDVSGSMDEWKKEMAKRFFMLLLLFLQYNYERVDIVWIRHHSSAKECDEEEFFYSQESGGTVVSPAYELMAKIIKERYPLSQWNIFGTHISDGDDFIGDRPTAVSTLKDSILPICQYFAYVEVSEGALVGVATNSELYPHYKPLTESHKNFVMSVIGNVNHIYPIFRKLFEKQK
jgi:uncharacterized sporulation protein YeaH/YhbH (DUF444 family)